MTAGTTTGARPVAPPQALPTDEERGLLCDSVRGFLEQHWPVDSAVAAATSVPELRRIWRQLGGQGIAGLGQDPAEGGLREVLVVMQELGRAACPAPLADAALLNLLSRTGVAGAGGTAWSAMMSAMATGDAWPCFSFGAIDADPGVGGVTLQGPAASGTIGFVDGAIAATHFVVALADGQTLVLVSADAPGVTVAPARAMGADGQCQVSLVAVPATTVAVDATCLRDLLRLSRLIHTARACGAARRAFDLVVPYVKERKQFGQPVGRFQAVQHKLADILIDLEAVRLSLDNAASHYDRGIAHWHTFASAACAFGNTALRRVSLQTHHAFGAVAYADIHEAPRHFKRVHLDVLRHGGARPAREEMAARYLGEAPNEFPEYDLGEAGNAFRREVRAWLAQHWPAQRRDAYEAADTTHRDFDAQFARELGQTGWLGLTWPKQFGGMERSPFELLAFMEEMNRAEAPRAGAPIQAAAWMAFGRPEQQQHYLPELLRGEKLYGMWYSEPDSGSDLVSMRTRAVRDGDHWVINGQKIWTTTYFGDYMWLAARTDPSAKPHAGISMFVVPTDTPGITRRPIGTMYDGEFCNTFFDDVRVPADALVGELNRGWDILIGSLGAERAYVGGVILMKVARQFEQLCDLIRDTEIDGRPLRLDPLVRDTIGDYAAQIEAGRQLALNCVSILARGDMPTWEAAATKVFAGELMERFNESALDILGQRATLSRGSPGALQHGQLEQKLRHSLMWVISIGTNEIQRSLIAQRGLGLPR